MNNRRALLSATALAAPALALAACSTLESMTGTTTPTAAVQAIMLKAQYLLPLLDALALGISVAVPAAAPVLIAVTGYLNQASPIFQSLVATMSVAQAQPIVAQIETYAAAAVTQIQSVVANNPALSAYASRVAQAQAVVALLTAFANGVESMPTAATVPVPYLHS